MRDLCSICSPNFREPPTSEFRRTRLLLGTSVNKRRYFLIADPHVVRRVALLGSRVVRWLSCTGNARARGPTMVGDRKTLDEPAPEQRPLCRSLPDGRACHGCHGLLLDPVRCGRAPGDGIADRAG